MYSATCGKLGLTLSPKSELCTSDFKLSLLIVKILKKEGIHYQATRDARDLGITFTAGLLHKISAKHIRHRFLKTSKRNTKICRIENMPKERGPCSQAHSTLPTHGGTRLHTLQTPKSIPLKSAPPWPREFMSQADTEPSHC